jgi:hypothetical protein
MSIEQRETPDAILRQAAFPRTPASMTSGACSASSCRRSCRPAPSPIPGTGCSLLLADAAQMWIDSTTHAAQQVAAHLLG